MVWAPTGVIERIGAGVGLHAAQLPDDVWRVPFRRRRISCLPAVPCSVFYVGENLECNILHVWFAADRSSSTFPPLFGGGMGLVSANVPSLGEVCSSDCPDILQEATGPGTSHLALSRNNQGATSTFCGDPTHKAKQGFRKCCSPLTPALPTRPGSTRGCSCRLPSCHLSFPFVGHDGIPALPRNPPHPSKLTRPEFCLDSLSSQTHGYE
jgi:hypothetical protein